VGWQDGVEGLADGVVVIPKLAADLFLSFVAQNGVTRDLLDEVGDGGDEFDFAFAAEGVEPFLGLALHDGDVVRHLVVAEGFVEDGTLFDVGLVGGEEADAAEDSLEEAVGLFHVQAFVGFGEEEFMVVGANDDGDGLVEELDGEDGAEGVVAALEEALAVFVKFENVAEEGETAGEHGWGGFHDVISL
jgi:hypothetical protein